MTDAILSIDWDWVTGDCGSGDICCGWCRPDNKRDTKGRGDNTELSKEWLEKYSYLMTQDFSSCHQVQLFIAECHADILRCIDATENKTLVHLDSHHDMWAGQALSCASWRYYLPKNIEVKFVNNSPLAFQSFKNESFEYKQIFICHSSPWTPAELDNQFYALVDRIFHSCTGRLSEPKFMGHRFKELLKNYGIWKESKGATK